jgi:hypothetical protein
MSQKASEAYKERKKKIAALMTELLDHLEKHEEDFYTGIAAERTDWGFAGDLGRIASGLEDLVAPFRQED